jgi:hypothetical protein
MFGGDGRQVLAGVALAEELHKFLFFRLLGHNWVKHFMNFRVF